jgi:LmbE family N-acetylglucosaminyl deacetylase
MSNSTEDSRVAIVVAHPDDEALWLSSALAKAGALVFCYGDPFQRPKLGAARRRAVAALQRGGLAAPPLPGLIDLQIPESGAGFAVDWPLPRMTEFGVAINEAEARLRYQENYPKLVASLRPVLASCREVYTHNPWGEYGHAEHFQVYRAVAALQVELGFTLWFSNYVSNRSWRLAQRLAGETFWAERIAQKPDQALARQLMGVYARAGAWTWTRLHRWPRLETLYASPPSSGDVPAGRTLAGESLLDTSRLRWWPPPLRNPLRLLV